MSLKLFHIAIVTLLSAGVGSCSRAPSNYNPVYSPQKTETGSSALGKTDENAESENDADEKSTDQKTQESERASNGLGSLDEKASEGGEGGETVSNCKFFKKDGVTRFSEAHPVDVPLPLNKHFDGSWNTDDTEYSFTMVIGEHIDKKQIGDLCFEDPENFKCAGKEPFQLLTKGMKIGERYSEHFFEVVITDANSSDCQADVSRR